MSRGKIHGLRARIGSGMNKSPAWVSILSLILPIAALGLCSWAMESAKNRGRELPGAKQEPALGPPAP
jgi:hypothetical protein